LAAPKSRWFKIGACEWSLGKSDPSCFQVAKEIGLDGVQVNLGSQRNDMQLCKPAVQKAYLAAAKAARLEIASLAISETNSVPLKRDPRAAQWLAASIPAAKALGVKVIMPACFGNGDLDMTHTQEIEHFVKVFRDVASQAEKEGLLLAIESYLSAEDNLRLLDRIGSPAMRVYYDVGNSTDKGRDIFREIRLLGNRICEFHAKDGKFLLGQGRIDFKKVRAAIDAIGYNGWFQLECARPHGLVADYSAQRKYLRTVFPERR
jgi:L-ribulose-5-phosphate 3-epimerase